MEHELRVADCVRGAREALRGHWGQALCICLALFLLGGTLYSSLPGTEGDAAYTVYVGGQRVTIASGYPLAVLAARLLNPQTPGAALALMNCITLACMLLLPMCQLGAWVFYLALARAQAAETRMLFSRGGIFWKAIGLHIVMVVRVFLWFLLFIVPGVIALLRYSFATAILAEHPEMSITEAIEESKRLTLGHKGKIFGIFAAFSLLIVLACMLTDWLWLLGMRFAAALLQVLAGLCLSAMADMTKGVLYVRVCGEPQSGGQAAA